MSQRKNVIKFNRDIKLNAATIIIFLVLIYCLLAIVISSKKDPITTYKVNKSSIDNNITLDAIALRDEQIINSNKAGYICYYIRDGEKVKNKSTVCTIDETGKVYDSVTDADNFDKLLKQDDYNKVRSVISLYKVGYKDVNFYSAYNFQTDVTNKVLELSNEVLMQQIKSEGGNVKLSAINAPVSGIVTYYTDGFENFNINSISASDFDKSKYEKNTLKTGDIVSNNTPIVKIIPNEEWNIVAPLSDNQVKALADRSSVKFKINNSSYSIRMPFTVFDGADGKYINIALDKYLTNYISERYVNIEIIMEEERGLKIPISSIVEKEVYKIPKGFFTGGGNISTGQSNNNRLNVKTKLEDGTDTLVQIVPNIFVVEDNFCLVDKSSLSTSDVIININNSKELAVSMMETTNIKGVYSANRGTAEFKMINIIKTIDEFVLIESDDRLKAYDNIILDSKKVKENQIIY